MAIHRKNLISISVGFLLVGCSSAVIKTTELPTNIADFKDRVGSVYYLPKALYPISIKSPNASKSAGTKSGASGATQQINTVNINGSKVDAGGNAGGGKDASGGQYTISIGTPIYIPDIQKAYFLEYNPSIFFDDNATIEVGDNQLLKTIDATSKDESGNTLVALVQLAAEVAKMTSGVPSSPYNPEVMSAIPGNKRNPPPMQYICESPKDSLDTHIDLSEQGIKELNKKLKDAHLPIIVKVGSVPIIDPTKVGSVPTIDPNIAKSASTLPQSTPSKSPISDWWDGVSDGCNSSNQCVTKGMLIRSPIPHTLTVITTVHTGDETQEGRFYRKAISRENNAVNTPQECVDKVKIEEASQDFLLMAPDGGPISSVDISRTPFVTKKTTVTTANGMLTKIVLDKPSEALGFVQIPLNMAKAIAAIPGSILSVQVKNTQDQASLYKAQADIFTQQLDLLKAKQNLLKAAQ